MALAWAWWIDPLHSSINRQSDYFIYCECSNRRSGKSQLEIWDLSVCQEEPNGYGGPYALNLNPMFDNNIAARLLNVAMKLSNPKLFCVIQSWPTSQWHTWCPDTHVWRLQEPSSRWNPRSSGPKYDWGDHGRIRYCWCDVTPKSKKLPNSENCLPTVSTGASKVDNLIAAIHCSYPKLCPQALWKLQARPCCWWGCGLAMQV
jgi:hypothetical protein